MCVKRLLLSLTPLLRYDTHTCSLGFFLLPFLFFFFFLFFSFFFFSFSLFFSFFFFFFYFCSVLLSFKLFFIYFLLLSFFLSLLKVFFSFLLSPPFFFLFFFFFFKKISVSSTLYHLSMRVFVMSIDSNFVLEFIAWVMVIMLVHSICQKWIHVRVRAWLALRVVHEATTFKGMRGRVSVVFISSLFSLKLTGCCIFWLYGPGTHCHP